ncbi:hypothetical protein [Streptomyces sp. NPDC003077]|uniref:hypothetical protein n=1 Tax=Streptomyces sp. NPDC003077 TaxID=3154443 RepID=UPI0033B3CF32
MTYREGVYVVNTATGLVGEVVQANDEADRALLRFSGDHHEWVTGRKLRLASAHECHQAAHEAAGRQP